MYYEVIKLKAKWEKRRNGYFAYARQSYYDQDEKKTKTLNKYLGSNIKSAVGQLRLFADELKIDPATIEQLAKDLQLQGQKLGIKSDDYKYDSCDFTELFHSRFAEIQELILEADTSQKRNDLRKDFVKLASDVFSYVNSTKA